MKILISIAGAALLLATAGCASTGYESTISHAMRMCMALNEPDAESGEGEAWFWFQSERAEASRKLWSRRGLEAIDVRKSGTHDPAERACIDQLHQEATARQLNR